MGSGLPYYIRSKLESVRMGYWKELAMELQDPDHLGSDPEYFVCAKCFDDDALKQLIVGHAEEYTCSYCGRRSRKRPIAAPLDILVERINEGLQRRYDDAA